MMTMMMMIVVVGTHKVQEAINDGTAWKNYHSQLGASPATTTTATTTSAAAAAAATAVLATHDEAEPTSLGPPPHPPAAIGPAVGIAPDEVCDEETRAGCGGLRPRSSLTGDVFGCTRQPKNLIASTKHEGGQQQLGLESAKVAATGAVPAGYRSTSRTRKNETDRRFWAVQEIGEIRAKPDASLDEDEGKHNYDDDNSGSDMLLDDKCEDNDDHDSVSDMSLNEDGDGDDDDDDRSRQRQPSSGWLSGQRRSGCQALKTPCFCGQLPFAEPSASDTQESMSVPFCVIAPGRAVIPAFRAIDSSKCVTEILNPREVDEIVFFLLPNSPVPPGHAAVLYFSVPSSSGAFENWEVLGALGHGKPSGVFRTSWGTNEQMKSTEVVQLGVSVETEDVITNLNLGAGGVQDRKQFALKIAKDLFQFMSSFSQATQAGAEVMVVPTNVLDRWIQRFESKYNRDPNFMLK
eukprot:g16092.t1